MGDIWRIAVGSGLSDGLNPCMLMTCAVFILHGMWADKNSLQPVLLRIIFVLTYVAGDFFFNFSPAEGLVFQKSFLSAAKDIYLVLGVCAFVFGIIFLRAWFLLRHQRQPVLTGTTSPYGNTTSQCSTAFMLALGLSALATLWPVNYYMILTSGYGLLNAQWEMLTCLLGIYVIVSMWPLWFLWSFLTVKNLRPALVKIVCASVFFAASSSVIFIFK